jgi:hypothetical protein
MASVVALAFLAAEAAAHAPHLDPHAFIGTPRHRPPCAGSRSGAARRNARPCRRPPAAGERGLALEVEMLLPADLDPCPRSHAARAPAPPPHRPSVDARAFLEDRCSAASASSMVRIGVSSAISTTGQPRRPCAQPGGSRPPRGTAAGPRSGCVPSLSSGSSWADGRTIGDRRNPPVSTAPRRAPRAPREVEPREPPLGDGRQAEGQVQAAPRHGMSST